MTDILPIMHQLPPDLEREVNGCLEIWRAEDRIHRLWDGDAQIWTGDGEADWLGWLEIAAEQRNNLDAMRDFADEVRVDFSDVLLLGMGGSSLCPEVLASTFGQQEDWPALHVLDSTDPAQIGSFEERLDLKKTLFVVSSKSGTTLEPNALLSYFLDRARQVVGTNAGRRFVAITDPGSKLEDLADDLGFLRVFHGVPSIGGRFSALSHFGLVPAALMGLDVERLIDAAAEMERACRPDAALDQNPGAMLGMLMGVAGSLGQDKFTFVLSPAVAALGAWLEQLIAESTGKDGKAIIPIDGEALLAPVAYGEDRLFVHLHLESEATPEIGAALGALRASGQPIVRVPMDDLYGLGGEFFRWEFATAVAGSVMSINPFDQPDVEASKVATRMLTDEYEANGFLPTESPFAEQDGLQVLADVGNTETLVSFAGEGADLTGILEAHFGRLDEGGYFALLAYVEMNQANRLELQAIRRRVLERKGVATSLGFGPRFLHSTGQAYKGGPNNGVFIQITCDDPQDLPVPGKKYTFGVIKAAQARGDFEVLADRQRRALRVHIKGDVTAGLRRFGDLVRDALS